MKTAPYVEYGFTRDSIGRSRIYYGAEVAGTYRRFGTRNNLLGWLTFKLGTVRKAEELFAKMEPLTSS